MYGALDVVSRELVGFIPAVNRDARAARVAVGQLLTSPITPVASASNIAVGMAFPAENNQVIGNSGLTITKAREVTFSWTGEETLGLSNGGADHGLILVDQFAQAMRTLTNEMEADIALAAYRGASRAHGTAGTTPFATNLGETAQLRKILDDNGAPLSDRALVMNTSAGANVRTLSQLTKVNEAGESTLLRQGTLLDIHGFALKESAQVPTVTKGTGAGYLVNNGAGYAVGSTAITVDTGTGTILAGDVITFAGDTNKYVVASALAANVVTLAAPGLRQGVADNAAITVGNSFAANVGFTRNAITFGARLPALPSQGDMAADRKTVRDVRSGISFEVSLYLGKRMVTYAVAAAWGVSVTKPEHTAILLG
jgi:hypothetical protein